MQKKINKIKGFLYKESKKRGFSSVVFGLSGGIDSAVVAHFCTEVFKDKARAYIMPSLSTNPTNTQDAIKYASSLSLYYEVIDISSVQQSFIQTLGLHNSSYSLHRIGNLCARSRMCILYDMSFLHNSLVIGCSNKSELMLGYGTIYGDLAYSINPIGELYKSEIFALAKIIGVPEYIINKKPSADLFQGQNDEADLGYTYKDIDELLKYIDKGLSKKELLNLGFKLEFVESILNRIKKNKFKLSMPKIAKL
ncbi:NAD+ synthase [Helicobacter sp. MIT 14-3879]|uniref:NAD+ synthase n=1 Tax=Helicobacter sp. MIT 14-3879 TaxID=2040649 RepID=UPI000E1F5757|nr:NAD+ synthase [Helicobacter sp. MIT 14-3879]RDU65518.1 NAD(+) synthetase [Helicobacter sp. MIT 14-3879]